LREEKRQTLLGRLVLTNDDEGFRELLDQDDPLRVQRGLKKGRRNPQPNKASKPKKALGSLPRAFSFLRHRAWVMIEAYAPVKTGRRPVGISLRRIWTTHPKNRRKKPIPPPWKKRSLKVPSQVPSPHNRDKLRSPPAR